MISLSDLILVIPNVLSKDECNTLINTYNNIETQEYYEESFNTSLKKQQFATFKTKEIKSDCDEYGLVILKLEFALKEWTNYLESLNSFAVSILKNNLNFPHKIRILKYNTGDSIHPHVDFNDYHFASCTLNLNDDYQGGDFCFFNQKFNLQLKAGDALVFPNNHFFTHEVLSITEGTRFSVNSFITSIPETKIRALNNFWNLDEIRNKKFFHL